MSQLARVFIQLKSSSRWSSKSPRYSFLVFHLAIVVFEIILNASAMFNHSNAKLGLSIDKKLRKVIVTPDMHRVHHSVIVKETHSNFGFSFPFGIDGLERIVHNQRLDITMS